MRQLCGVVDELAKAIDTREQQQHLDDAISDDNNGDFSGCVSDNEATATVGDERHSEITLRVVA